MTTQHVIPLSNLKSNIEYGDKTRCQRNIIVRNRDSFFFHDLLLQDFVTQVNSPLAIYV